MQIAYICADPGIPVFGRKGASVHIQEIVRAFRLLGHEVTLFALRFGEDRPTDLADLPVHSLPSISAGKTAEREQQAMALNEKLPGLLAQVGPFDLIYERYSLWSTAGMRFANEAGIPGLLEVNAPLIAEQTTHRSLFHQEEARHCAREVFARASHLIAVSEPVAHYLAEFPETQGKVRVIANGVNPERFRPAGVPVARPFTVGFVGTLKPWHGLPTLLEGFAHFHHKLPDSRLLIVGDGPERGQIEDFICTHRLTKAVRLTGAIAPEAVPLYLQQMDVAVAPYPATDNLYFSPLKAYEYLAAGVPLIASRVGQLETVLQHSQTCLFCEPGSAADLSTKLQQLANNPVLRQQLAVNGRNLVLAAHSWTQVAQTILETITPETVSS